MKTTLTLCIILGALTALGQSVFRSVSRLASLNRAGTPAANTLTNGLVAYWTLDDTNNLADSTGRGHTLTMDLNPTNATGLISGAMGTWPNNAAFTADSDDFSASGGHSLTIIGWASRASKFGVRSFASKWNTDGSKEWLIFTPSSSDVLTFWLGTNAVGQLVVDHPQTFVNNTWCLIVAQIDATNSIARIRWARTNVAMYAWAETSIANWSGTNTNARLEVGSAIEGASSYGWYGALDEVAIYRRLLTDTEITNIWNSGAGMTYPFQ